MSVHIGVEVEYLRQVLAYDSVKQLLSDAHLYGLSFEVSETQTTIRFGQKTKQKMHVFVGACDMLYCIETIEYSFPPSSCRAFIQSSTNQVNVACGSKKGQSHFCSDREW